MKPVPIQDIIERRERLGISELWRPQGVLPSLSRVFIYGRREGNEGLRVSFPRSIVLFPRHALDRRGNVIGRGFPSAGFLPDALCVAIPEAPRIPDSFKRWSEATGTTVFSSHYDDSLLESRLIGVLREEGERRIMVHGVFVEVSHAGVLIMGESGIGKTSCGLELVAQGGFWIADDAVVVERRRDFLYGRGHKRTKRLIAVRGKGILPAGKLLRPGAVRKEIRVDVIIEFLKSPAERAGGNPENRPVLDFMGVSLPCCRLVGGGGPRMMARHVTEAVKALRAL